MPPIAGGTDRDKRVAPPATELPPCLRQVTAHPDPKFGSVFSTIRPGSAKHHHGAVATIHAIAKEGAVYQTEPSILFGGRHATWSQVWRPRKRRNQTSAMVPKPGYDRRQSPASGGS